MPPLPQSKLMQTRIDSQLKNAKSTRDDATSMAFNAFGKQEAEDEKIHRYERVIEQLKKMVETVKK
jgi:hypothetical protein